MENITRRSVLAGMAALAVAGCSSEIPSDDAIVTDAPTPTPTPSPTPTPKPVWPLTGLPLDDVAAANHAAVAVKVPDNKSEHPQVGIDQADIVFVQLDGYRDSKGYSGTRLVPVFHSTMAADAAAVRSIRPVDAPTLVPMRAIVGNTGGAGWTTDYFKQFATVLDVEHTYMATRGTNSYSIDSARVYTYNGSKYYDRAVVCHPPVLAQQSSFTAPPPQTYFPFAVTAAAASTAKASASPAASIKVPWKGNDYFMGYDYDAASGLYLRSEPWGPHILANKQQVTTTNVLVILATQTYEHDEPFHGITDATGVFYYGNAGKAVKGTWSKGAIDSLFTFQLDDGTPLAMAPGKTFVELAKDTAQVAIA